MDTNKYTVIKDGGRYTIGVYDADYAAYIINDGICEYYWWETESAAQAAATAINEYEGNHGLDNHGYGYDTMTISEAEEAEDDYPELVALYRLFDAIVDDDDADED